MPEFKSNEEYERWKAERAKARNITQTEALQETEPKNSQQAPQPKQKGKRGIIIAISIVILLFFGLGFYNAEHGSYHYPARTPDMSDSDYELMRFKSLQPGTAWLISMAYPILIIAFFVAPFFVNCRLVKSRGREEDMCLWMLFTLLLSWLSTFILLIMKPKETQ